MDEEKLPHASITATLGASAAPYKVKLGNRTILLGAITQITKSGLERWLYDRYVDNIVEIRPKLTPEEFDKKLDDALEKRTVGEFSWGGTLMIKTMGQLEGISKTLSLISTEIDGKEVSVDDIQKGLLDREQAPLIMHAFKCVFEDSMPQKKTDQPERQLKPIRNKK